MDSLMKMQNLAVTVNGLKESIHLQSVRVSAISSENIHAASKYHSTFGQLLNKYCIFANEYKSQLTNLHEVLLNDISIVQKEREEKIELLSCKSTQSNSPNNLEIVENVEQNEYFSQKSPNLNSINMNLSSSDYSESCDIDTSIPSEIQPMQSKKSIPISPKPSPKKNENEKKNKDKKSTDKKNEDIKEKEEKNDEDNKYVYNARNVKFNLPFKVWNKETKKYEKKVYKHTTMIFIGNISLNVKVYALQQFLIKKFEITLKQIVNTKLYRARNGLSQYALVMLKGDISKDHITKCMDIINSDNAMIKENKNKNKNAVKSSWQNRVFIKYQDPEYHYSYYRNSYEMYNDSRVRHELFIRNFDILSKKFHRKFTEKLLSYGDLYEDINVNIDHYGNPYCIVTFKYKNDAVNVCNSEIYFGNKRLDIRYSNKISYLDDLIKHQYQ